MAWRRFNFQGRYIFHHSVEGDLVCEAASEYRELVKERQETEIDNLASLMGWKAKKIRDRLEMPKTELHFFPG